MKRFLIATAFCVIILSPRVGLAFTRGPCTDTLDCYCDCVENPGSTGADVGGFANAACQTKAIPIDANLIWCEDFENPTYEDPVQANNEWFDRYNIGGTCSSDNNSDTVESATHGCTNIMQRNDPACSLYDAGDDDLNESGGHPTLDGTWDGCQTWGFAIRSEDNNATQARGGAAARFSLPDQVNGYLTYSLTHMVKYSSNHFLPDQAGITGTGNAKADRFLRGNPNTGFFNVPTAAEHGIVPAFCCSDSKTPDIWGDHFPFAALIKASRLSGMATSGILDQGVCCTPECFAQTRTGIECHHTTDGDVIRHMIPPESLWNPGVAGGVPMSTEGDKDGLDEWLCYQWTLADTQTDLADYIHYINEAVVVSMVDYPGAFDNGGDAALFSIDWFNVLPLTNPNTTDTDWIQVRDNYHLTASATPVPCTQIGFGSPAAPGAGVTINPGVSLR